MKTLHTTLVITLFGLAGCATKVPTNHSYYPPAPQQKIQAAHHWDVVAANVAERLRSALGSVEATGQTGQPIVLHVQKPTYGVFNEAFHELLVTQLLAHGFGVSDKPTVGLPVIYDVQLISHNERDYPHIFAAPVPNKELVLNVSVMSGDRYLTRMSDIYYVSEGNYTQYLAQGPITRRMEVVGP